MHNVRNEALIFTHPCSLQKCPRELARKGGSHHLSEESPGKAGLGHMAEARAWMEPPHEHKCNA